MVGTPLHKAAFRGHFETVASLLKAGSNPKLATGVGTTALEMAITNKHDRVVELLTKK